MKEFKGTKGQLEPIYIGTICIGIGTVGEYSQVTANSLLPETDEEYETEKEEIEANMRLYAASPELLEALTEIYETINSPGVTNLNWISNRCSESINKALGK